MPDYYEYAYLVPFCQLPTISPSTGGSYIQPDCPTNIMTGDSGATVTLQCSTNHFLRGHIATCTTSATIKCNSGTITVVTPSGASLAPNQCGQFIVMQLGQSYQYDAH